MVADFRSKKCGKRISKFEMTNLIWRIKNSCIFLTMSIQRFLGSLNPNLVTEFQNSEWQIKSLKIVVFL